MKKIVLYIAIALLLAGCKTKERIVTVEKVVERTDTLRHSRDIRDSVYVHDSIYASERRYGDTVLITKEQWHTRWRERVKRDTLYASRRDSVAVPVPYAVEVVKEVEKKLTWWQKLRIHVGGIVLFLLLLLAVWWCATKVAK